MKFYCIADEDTVRGFRLAGVAGETVISPEEITRAITAAAAQSDCGIIIITEQCAEQIRPLVERFRLERERPLLVEIPDSGGPLPGRKSLWCLVQEAVGISLEAHRGTIHDTFRRQRP